MVVTVLDMSEVRHLHQQLEFQAVTDLTGLLNRRGFHQAVESICCAASARTILVLYLDLDGFKRVNDSLGHDAGDRVLRWVSEQLQSCLRSYDIPGAWGAMNSPRCWSWSFRSRRRKFGRTDRAGVHLPAGRRFGCDARRQHRHRHVPDCGANLDGLRAADIAMYEAKRAGRQQYRYYDQEMNGRARSRLMLEERRAHGHRQQGLQLVYQPQVSSRTAFAWRRRRCCAGSTPASAMCRRGCFCRCWKRRG
jgi:GGDEF domain-containing protein